ncbi:MAG: DMT family transporter [Acidobacteriota bacterium]
MPSRGVMYMAGSAFAFSVMALLVKLASDELPTGEIVLARAAVTLVLSYAMLRRRGVPVWGHNKRGLLLRGCIGFCALACYYVSLRQLPLADATTLQNTTPLVTALLAWWLLGERVGWATAAAIAIGLVGVVLIVHPSGGGADALGVAVALGGATCSGIAYVTVRQLSKREHPLVIVFYFPLVATPLALPWALHDFVWPSPTGWLLLAAMGAATQLGQVFMTLGLTLVRAGRATAINFLQVCFAMVWQVAFFAKQPALATIGGAALIIGGTLLVSASERSAPAAP